MANLDIIIKTLGGENLKALNDQGAGAIQSLTGLNLASVSLAGGIALMGEAAKKEVSETMDYATQVRELSRITGDGAENTSRLIQVADDLAISEGNLSSAMEAATNKGVDVSIEGLKRLSDQYISLEPGLQRSNFLMDTFGRSGMTMAAMMEQGATNIDKMTAAIDDSMVMKQEDIDASRNLEIEMDNLGDAMQGLGYTIGKTLIPQLTSAANGLYMIMTYGKNVDAVHREQARSAAEAASSYEEYAAAVLDSYVRTGDIAKEQRDATLTMIAHGNWTQTLADNYNVQSRATFEATKRLAEEKDMMDAVGDSVVEVTSKKKTQADLDKEAKKAEEDYAKALKEVSGAAEAQFAAIEKLSSSRRNSDFYDAAKQSLSTALESGSISPDYYKTAMLNLGLGFNKVNEGGIAAADAINTFNGIIGQFDPSKTAEIVKALKLESVDGSKADFSTVIQPFIDLQPKIGDMATTTGNWANSSKDVEQSLTNISMNAKPQMDKAAVDLTNAYTAMNKGFFTPTNKALNDADEYLKSIANRAASLKAWADANEIVIHVRVEMEGSIPDFSGGNSRSIGRVASTAGLSGMWTGGFAEANDVILVGENGPELFVPPYAGRVLNNTQSQNIGGATVINNFNFKDASLDVQEYLRIQQMTVDLAGGY